LAEAVAGHQPLQPAWRSFAVSSLDVARIFTAPNAIVGDVSQARDDCARRAPDSDDLCVIQF